AGGGTSRAKPAPLLWKPKTQATPGVCPDELSCEILPDAWERTRGAGALAKEHLRRSAQYPEVATTAARSRGGGRFGVSSRAGQCLLPGPSRPRRVGRANSNLPGGAQLGGPPRRRRRDGRSDSVLRLVVHPARPDRRVAPGPARDRESLPAVPLSAGDL